MRYNRNDYSACDWSASKSDILRDKAAVSQRRKITLANVLGIMALVVVIVVTLDSIFKLYN